jgi:integrase
LLTWLLTSYYRGMARKRANAMGSIYKNATRNRWQADLVVGYKPHATRVDPDGKPVMVPVRKAFTGATQKAVAAKLDDAMKALERGLAVPDNRTTVNAFAEWWLDHVLPGEGLAPATERWYRDVLTTYVLPHVGAKTLTGPTAVTVHDVEQMTAKLDRDGKSTRVQVGARVALGKLLRAAEQRGLVARNVARLATRPKDRGKARTIKALNATQVAKLVTAVTGTRWHPIVVVGVTTGLRPGELLGLCWEDVHLTGTAPQLSVRHAISHVDGATLKAPKRARSYRTVPLALEAVAALKAWKKLQSAERLAAGEHWSRDWPGLIFTNELGEPTRVDTFRHALGRAVPGAIPHALRHSYATHLLEAGTPIHHVAELLGDSVAIVESTYSHSLRTKDETAAVASGILG